MNQLADVIELGPEDEARRLWKGALAAREVGEGLFRALRRTRQCVTPAKWTTLTLLGAGVVLPYRVPGGSQLHCSGCRSWGVATQKPL